MFYCLHCLQMPCVCDSHLSVLHRNLNLYSVRASKAEEGILEESALIGMSCVLATEMRRIKQAKWQNTEE